MMDLAIVVIGIGTLIALVFYFVDRFYVRKGRYDFVTRSELDSVRTRLSNGSDIPRLHKLETLVADLQKEMKGLKEAVGKPEDTFYFGFMLNPFSRSYSLFKRIENINGEIDLIKKYLDVEKAREPEKEFLKRREIKPPQDRPEMEGDE